MRCRCEYKQCDCIPTGATVRFKGGLDTYEITGHAKTQPKAIIEVDGEAVYVPYTCLEEVTTDDRQKLDLARAELERLCKSAVRRHASSSVRFVPVSELYTLKEKIK